MEQIDSVSEPNQRPVSEATLAVSSGQPKERYEEDCYAEILKDDIIKLDESSISVEGHTRPQDPIQMHPSPQGTSQRRIRLRVGNSKHSPAVVRFPCTMHSSKSTFFARITISLVFEWKQQLVADVDSNPSVSQKQHQISKAGETVKEKLCYQRQMAENGGRLKFGHINTPLRLMVPPWEVSGNFLYRFGLDSLGLLSHPSLWIFTGEIRYLSAPSPDPPLLHIILVQEKNIRRLNELVRHLQEQLQQCRGRNGTINGTVSPLAERILELERQQILED
ncbi:hypothetical protein D0Y65_034824 [Glycine soja]|uniref:Uncharacterized protein n=1 Tax=Glycine soja TaxID=3848 RepID=A0A445HS65_GLYSO|nr:hypothetical protein D0Y65_034824 [Glycine soja]